MAAVEWRILEVSTPTINKDEMFDDKINTSLESMALTDWIDQDDPNGVNSRRGTTINL